MLLPSHTMRLAGALIALAVGLGLSGPADSADRRVKQSVDVLEVKPEKQTLLQLYVRASEAIEYLRWHRDMILIDVRPAAELPAHGVAAPTSAHVPFLVEGPQLAATPMMRINHDFEPDIRALLAARGLDTTATLILICSYGILSARAADMLAEAGFHNVYTVIDGFDGDPGPEGVRRMNGWRTLGLPTVPDVHNQPPQLR